MKKNVVLTDKMVKRTNKDTKEITYACKALPFSFPYVVDNELFAKTVNVLVGRRARMIAEIKLEKAHKAYQKAYVDCYENDTISYESFAKKEKAFDNAKLYSNVINNTFSENTLQENIENTGLLNLALYVAYVIEPITMYDGEKKKFRSKSIGKPFNDLYSMCMKWNKTYGSSAYAWSDVQKDDFNELRAKFTEIVGALDWKETNEYRTEKHVGKLSSKYVNDLLAWTHSTLELKKNSLDAKEKVISLYEFQSKVILLVLFGVGGSRSEDNDFVEYRNAITPMMQKIEME